MINFNEEIKKYKYILNIDDVEDSIKKDEILDIMDLLQYISKKNSTNSTKG